MLDISFAQLLIKAKFVWLNKRTRFFLKSLFVEFGFGLKRQLLLRRQVSKLFWKNEGCVQLRDIRIILTLSKLFQVLLVEEVKSRFWRFRLITFFVEDKDVFLFNRFRHRNWVTWWDHFGFFTRSRILIRFYDWSCLLFLHFYISFNVFDIFVDLLRFDQRL